MMVLRVLCRILLRGCYVFNLTLLIEIEIEYEFCRLNQKYAVLKPFVVKKCSKTLKIENLKPLNKG